MRVDRGECGLILLILLLFFLGVGLGDAPFDLDLLGVFAILFLCMLILMINLIV